MHKTVVLLIFLGLLSGCLVEAKRSPRSGASADAAQMVGRLNHAQISSANKISGQKMTCFYQDLIAHTSGEVHVIWNTNALQFFLRSYDGNERIAEFALEEMEQKAQIFTWSRVSSPLGTIKAQARLTVTLSEIMQWNRHLDLSFELNYSTGQGSLSERLYSTSFGELDEYGDAYTSIEFGPCY